MFCEPEIVPGDLAGFFAAARSAFPARVQSARLGAPPFPDWLPRRAAAAAAEFAAAWQAAGADYISLARSSPPRPGLARPHPGAAGRGRWPVRLGRDRHDRRRPTRSRCWDAARLVRRVSTLHADGFGNLFLGALAGCGPGHPFLPASYHGGGPARFAIAVESADVALDAIRGATSLDEARARLVAGIEDGAAAIVPVAERLAAEFGVAFGGLDFSLAPLPDRGQEPGAALEALGVPAVGAPGGLFAAAFITEAIDRARFPRTGFSGLMLPVLEDATLARRAAEGALALNDLLLYSAVCGVGLDTIPLPGDTSEATLAGILLDTAALSARLRKPLVARLMPLPGLRAGDATSFYFEYFAPSRVMAA